MSSHDELDLVQIAEAIFSEATEAHILTEDNRDDIHETFADLITQAIGSGRVVVTGQAVARLVEDYCWMKVNATAARRTQSLLRQLTAGQLSMDGVDDVLDEVITAGKRRRTTLRHLNSDDIDRMVDERRDNRDKQAAAFDEFESMAARLRRLIVAHGSIPEAIASGAIHLATEGERQAAAS